MTDTQELINSTPRDTLGKALFKLKLYGILVVVLLCSIEHSNASQEELDNLLSSYPGLQHYTEGDLILRIYGVPFGTGNSPTETAENFLTNHSEVYGVPFADLDTIGPNYDGTHAVGLMYDAQTSSYKFSLVSYTQYRDGVPVFNTDIRLLIRNDANLNYPLVLAASTLRDIGDFTVTPELKAIDMDQVVASFSDPEFPELTITSEPRRVVWAGTGESIELAKVGIEFTGDDGADPVNEEYSYVIDILTGEIIYKASTILEYDVQGTVSGYTTFGYKPDECSYDVLTPLPYMEVSIVGGDTVYSDSNGNFEIPNEGTENVTVLSPMRGKWFFVDNRNGAEDDLTITTTPLESVNFVHNSSQTVPVRGQSNAYLFANTVRDFAMKFNPNYPGLQELVELRVNASYCNPQFLNDNSTRDFMRINIPWDPQLCSPHTAERTIVYHEYGHLLIYTASDLTVQDQYGEGIGDALSVVLNDQPGLGFGHQGRGCENPLRDAETNLQYPCVSGSHGCAPLLSGCVWDTRNALVNTIPSTYTDVLSNLLVSSILLHGTYKISPIITIDFLTLDDDDGYFDNGAPHAKEIYDGFSIHNMMPEDPGKIWVNSATGDDLTADGSRYYPFATISAGILTATSGDTVMVLPGTYDENNINFQGKAITVKGHEAFSRPVIDPSAGGTLVIFQNGEDFNSVLDNFILRDGNYGVICYNSAPTIKRCTFLNQSPTYSYTGALMLWGSTWNSVGDSPAKIINCTFKGSTKSAIVDRSYDPPTIKNTIIYGNSQYGIHWNTTLNKPWEHPILSYNCVNGNGTNYYGGITDSGVGSIHVNPQLLSDGGLSLFSPCIDAGDPNPIYNDPDGSRNDMGGLPYQEPIGFPGHKDTQSELPNEFTLNQNYPNPFNPTTTISFSLPVASEYELSIWNILGQKVKTFAGESPAGEVSLQWDASNYASGIYLYKLVARDFVQTRKMMLLK